jgi:DNA-binding CsgD family transcriptional regulator
MDEDIRQIWLENNRRALAGETVNGEVDYIIGGKPGYFYNVVAPIKFRGKVRGLMGVNMDITELRHTENELRKATEELSIEREALEAKNIALREVLGQIEDEKKALKLQIAANVDRVIIPAIQRLRENCGDRLKKHVDNLESSLKTISAPFIEQLRTDYSQLTPRELEICKMIKNGMMSKEISEILNVSILTVHKHREMIRKKLGIKNKNVNLSSFLQSF